MHLHHERAPVYDELNATGTGAEDEAEAKLRVCYCWGSRQGRNKVCGRGEEVGGSPSFSRTPSPGMLRRVRQYCGAWLAPERALGRNWTREEGGWGRCWSAQMACVRACACAFVMIGLDDALVTWAAVIGLHIDQFAALGGGQSPSWTCQMASHSPH
ncbi:hypothetical protein F7725_003108 [Dissostichus mawsoni]|uniref:Uncharacterized protein n=1 Tax=Dissostichus mawsoni TaxID=36200 RepID=A0A7J5Y9D9_DISMA|nr:hypothetical protein F7725_003108 [Dissostichus mawsoni]